MFGDDQGLIELAQSFSGLLVSLPQGDRDRLPMTSSFIGGQPSAYAVGYRKGRSSEKVPCAIVTSPGDWSISYIVISIDGRYFVSEDLGLKDPQTGRSVLPSSEITYLQADLDHPIKSVEEIADGILAWIEAQAGDDPGVLHLDDDYADTVRVIALKYAS